MISNNFSKGEKKNGLKYVFGTFSHEIFEYLDSNDLCKLKMTNKFFFDLCECNNLFTNCIRSLDKMFINSIHIPQSVENSNSVKEKKSKFKEKFLFNKSLNSFMKGKDAEKYSEKRLQSAKRRDKEK